MAVVREEPDINPTTASNDSQPSSPVKQSLTKHVKFDIQESEDLCSTRSPTISELVIFPSMSKEENFIQAMTKELYLIAPHLIPSKLNQVLDKYRNDEFDKEKREAAKMLLKAVDLPSMIIEDTISGRPFLANSFGTEDKSSPSFSFRSPWSGYWFKASGEEDNTRESIPISNDELILNEVFNVYKSMYYGNDAISTVYYHPRDDNTIKVLIKKELEGKVGTWDSIHTIELNDKLKVKLTSTVMITDKQMPPQESDKNAMQALFSARLLQQMEKTIDKEKDLEHLIQILGPMVEEIEARMRSELLEVTLVRMRSLADKLDKKSSKQHKNDEDGNDGPRSAFYQGPSAEETEHPLHKVMF